MIALRRAEGIALVLAGACAVAVPALGARHVQSCLRDRVEPALARGSGVPISIGWLDASALGTLRLQEVAVGDVLRARAIEASISPSELLAGRVRAAEIRIEGPRVTVKVDHRGRSSVEDILSRVASRVRPAAVSRGSARKRLRRIVVVGGALVVELGSIGTLELSDVEIAPRPGGVRAVASSLNASWLAGGIAGRAQFPRVAADLRLWPARVDLGRPGLVRVAAVGGQIDLSARGHSLRVRDAAITRGLTARARPDARVRLDGKAEMPGADRPLRIELSRNDAGVEAELSGEEIPIAVLTPLFPRWIDASRATVAGRARVSIGTSPGGGVDLDVAGRATALVVDHPNLADRPVAIDAAIAGQASLFEIAGRRYAEVRRSVLAIGDLAIRLDGRAELAAGQSFPERAELAIELPRTDCARAFASLPQPMREDLSGLDASGTIAGSLHLAFDRFDAEKAALSIEADVADCRVVGEPTLADPRGLLATFTHHPASGGPMRVGPGEPDYAELRSLPAHVTGAWVAAEDARYWTHPGFDVHQIERSLAIDLSEGQLLRGGSTISQQLVKNVFLAPRRTLARKLQEAVLTWRVEAHLSKREILERYLNIIELGDRVHGITAAARYWFDKQPSRLSVREAAFLAALTPAPRTMTARIRERGDVDEFTNHRVDVVLRAMRQSRVIDDDTFERARRARLHLATHLAAR